MSDPARKTDIDIAEFERRLRSGVASRAVAEDPLAELARLVSAPAGPRRPQPIDALAPEARDALTRDEQDFLNELSLSIDRSRAPRPPEQMRGEDAFALDRARAAIDRAAAEVNLAAAQAKEEAVAAVKPPADPIAAPAAAAGVAAVADALALEAENAAAPPPSHPAFPPKTPHAVEFPALKLNAALRGGYDMHGLEEMTRLEDISRVAPSRLETGAGAPALPKVDLSAPVFAHPLSTPEATIAPESEAPPAADAQAPGKAYDSFDAPPPARDLDARLPGDDGFETLAPAVAAAALASERPPRNRRALAAIVAVVGVAVAAGGVAMTMKRGPRAASGEPPTIMASADPVKVAPPAAPAAPADQTADLLARKPADAKPDAGAKVVGRPEEPVDLAREAQKIVRTVPITAPQNPAIPRTPTGDSVQPDKLGSVFPEPKRVRTVSIRPDGSVIGGDLAPTPAKPEAPPAAAPAFAPSPAPALAKPAAPRAEVAAVTPSVTEAPASRALAEDKPAVAPRPRAATPAAQTPSSTPAAPRRPAAEKPVEKPAEKPAAKKVEKPAPAPARRPAAAPVAEAEPEAAPVAEAQQTERENIATAPAGEVRNPFAALFGRKETPAAAPTTTASTATDDNDDDAAPAKPTSRANVGSGSFAVQLSSSPSEGDARAAANRLGGRYAGQLGGRAVRVVKGEAAGRAVYRVRAGGMSKEGAVSACESIKSSGGACFVAHD